MYNVYGCSLTKKGGKNMYAIAIPKKIIMDLELGDRKVLTYCFLCAKCNKDQFAVFNLEQYFKYCGLKISKTAIARNKEFILDFKKIIDCGFAIDVSTEVDINSSALKTIREFKLNDNMFVQQSIFITIFSHEIDKIRNYCIDNPGIKMSKCLNLLTYIRSGYTYRKKDPIYVCWTKLNRMSEQTGMANATLNKYIDVLINLEIIMSDETKNYIRTDEFTGEKKYYHGYHIFVDAERYEYDNVKRKFVLDTKYNPKKLIKAQQDKLQTGRVVNKDSDDDLSSDPDDLFS